MRFCACALIVLLALGANAQSPSSPGDPNQLETSILPEQAQRALFPESNANTLENPFLLHINTVTPADLPAIRLYPGNKGSFPFLATLPNDGNSVNIFALKPCGMILPHVHPRATEQYLIISGEMTGGIAEENGGRQNITFNIGPGQSMLVPQGLVHYNTNKQCQPVVVAQIYNSADPGEVGLIGAMASLNMVDPEALATASEGGILQPKEGPGGPVALDNTCLNRCGLGADGGGLGGLSQEMQVFLGLANSSAPAPGNFNAPPPPQGFNTNAQANSPAASPTTSTATPPTTSTSPPPTSSSSPPPSSSSSPPSGSSTAFATFNAAGN